MKALLTSKRFWVFIAAAATAVGSAFGTEITWGQAIQGIVVAAGVLIASFAYRDPGTTR